MFGLLDRHPATHQGASDTRHQSIEQFVQLGGRRRRCAVEVGFVVLEGIRAIGHENMEMKGSARIERIRLRLLYMNERGSLRGSSAQ